jgi:hypothetical protein
MSISYYECQKCKKKTKMKDKKKHHLVVGSRWKKYLRTSVFSPIILNMHDQ